MRFRASHAVRKVHGFLFSERANSVPRNGSPTNTTMAAKTNATLNTVFNIEEVYSCLYANEVCCEWIVVNSDITPRNSPRNELDLISIFQTQQGCAENSTILNCAPPFPPTILDPLRPVC